MKKLPILISYAFRRSVRWDKIAEERNNLNLLIDSGAFTAFKQNKPVVLKDYELWLEQIIPAVNPAGYFTLDVIGDSERTKANFLQMKRDGFNPIPIFTRGTPKEDLDFYFGEAETVGIGGIQMKADNARGYLKNLMRSINGRPVHLLGYTIHEDLVTYRPKSADSSNWKSSALFGQISSYTPQGFVSVSKKSFWKYSKIIEGLGYDADTLRDDNAWRTSRGLAHRISSSSYLGYVEKMKKRLDVNVHLAVAKKEEVEVLVDAFNQRNEG